MPCARGASTCCRPKRLGQRVQCLGCIEIVGLRLLPSFLVILILVDIYNYLETVHAGVKFPLMEPVIENRICSEDETC